MAIIGAVFLVVLVGFGINIAIHRVRGVAASDAMLKIFRVSKAIWHKRGMRFKVKTMVSFYQCIAAVPSAFDVAPPAGLEEYTRWIDMVEMPSELENIFIPSACLGNYQSRLWVGSSWPIGLALFFAAVFVGGELLKNCCYKAEGRQGIGTAVRIGLQRALPMTLGLTFFVVPSASMRIFRTFGCEPIEYATGDVRRYLRADVALNCDSNEYDVTRSTALLMCFVWPVGVPLMYA
eukprot:4514925-Prymnesium_polylepis.1